MWGGVHYHDALLWSSPLTVSSSKLAEEIVSGALGLIQTEP